jgi:hypothetical protein
MFSGFPISFGVCVGKSTAGGKATSGL